jgi:hypothetical protein
MREALLQYTLDAKRALSLAQSIVGSTFVNLIDSSSNASDTANALLAQSRFLRKAVSNQLQTLQLIIEKIQLDQSNSQQRFEVCFVLSLGDMV